MESLNSPSKPQIKPFSSDYEQLRSASFSDVSTRFQRSQLGIHAEYSSHARKSLKNDKSATPAQLQKRQKNRRMRKAGKMLPQERIANCQLAVAPEYNFVTVNVNPVNSSSSFQGLVCCESYSCPHCSAARSERDRHELTIALAAAEKRGWHPFMVTLTLRHNPSDKLAELQQKLAGAFDRCFSGRWWMDTQNEYAIKTKIKTWETTFGQNGWHPHMHLLMWTSLELNEFGFAGLQKTIGLRWLESLKKHNASASLEYTISIETANSKVADYIAKWGHEPVVDSWGVESEMTKGHAKKSRGVDGMTPFELLGAAAGEADQLAKLANVFKGLEREQLEERAGQLYVEYFRAFKGKARLHWGRTKELLKLDEELKLFAEAEAAQAQPVQPDDEIYPMVMIERGIEWTKVTGGYKGDDLRAALMEACESGDPFEVQAWLKQHGITGLIPDVAWERFNRLGGRCWVSPGDGWQPAAGGRLI